MLEVSSDGLADVEALLAIANVCQIVTVEDIKTLEDIKERLGHTRAGSISKQVRPPMQHGETRRAEAARAVCRGC